MAHRLDPLSQFCIRCGASLEEIIDHGAREKCEAGDNVVGISHVISARRIAASLTTMAMDDPRAAIAVGKARDVLHSR